LSMWKRRSSVRIGIGAVGVVGAIFLPVWVPVVAIGALALLWRAWEAMVIGLLIDLVWSPFHAAPLFTIGAIVAVWALEPIRKEFLP